MSTEATIEATEQTEKQTEKQTETQSQGISQPTLAANINADKPKRIKAALYKLRIAPDSVVIMKANGITPDVARGISDAFNRYHRHSLLLFLPEGGSLETMPRKHLEQLVDTIAKMKARDSATEKTANADESAPAKSFNPFRRRKAKATA